MARAREASRGGGVAAGAWARRVEATNAAFHGSTATCGRETMAEAAPLFGQRKEEEGRGRGGFENLLKFRGLTIM